MKAQREENLDKRESQRLYWEKNTRLNENVDFFLQTVTQTRWSKSKGGNKK